jgi:hypothetical protein
MSYYFYDRSSPYQKRFICHYKFISWRDPVVTYFLIHFFITVKTFELISGSSLEPIAEPSSTLAIVCGNSTAENEVAIISCPAYNQSINYVAFASYGTPGGTCGQFVIGDCNSSTSMSVVRELCIGKQSCSVLSSYLIFGDPCYSTSKHLYIQVSCKGE